MKTTDIVRSKVGRMPKGFVFTYEDVSGEVSSKEAIIKTLNRMVASGRISKLSKGRYYKPEKTDFGELQPNQYQVVKDLLEQNGKVIGYLTGYSIYSKLGLSTQVSNTIQIGKNEVRPGFKRGRFTIKFVKQKNIITRDSIPLLQVLDAIRFVKRIPDSTLPEATKRLLSIIRKLSDQEMATAVKLAQKYPPSTRALLGAILDNLGRSELAAKLRKSLNPITEYDYPGVKSVIPEAENWQIK